ncbi:MAG: hypothetical protein FD124_1765 [Alphaproteobacteria bacterium]|nr:MAG: hypothetical protein FD124_1765 [Alphaproteobacteria bacterium]
MIGVLFVSLFQAVAGAPSTPPTTDPAPASAPAAQAAAPGGVVAPAPNAKDARNQLRCRTQRVTGSRMGRRVCMTPAEEEAWRQDSRAYLERVQSQMPATGN